MAFPNFPKFTWDAKAGRYRGAAGKFVSGQRLRVALDDYLDAHETEALGVAEQLRRREISIADFQRDMEARLTKIHLNAAALARGGVAQMDDGALQSAGEFLKSELEYLRRFAVQIEMGLPLNGRFLDRVKQYIAAGRAHFEEIEDELAEGRGYVEERSIRNAGDSCFSCIFWESVSWQPLGVIPPAGSRKRICGRKCRCRKERRKSASEPVLDLPRSATPDTAPLPVPASPNINVRFDENAPARSVEELLEQGKKDYRAALSVVSLTESTLFDQPLNPSIRLPLASGKVGDDIVPQIAARQGMDGLPTVVSREEMNRLIRHLEIDPENTFAQFVDDYRELDYFRGLSPTGSEKLFENQDAKAGATDFKEGRYFVGSVGQWGKGIYFSSKLSTAKFQYARDENGSLIHAILKPEARMITYQKLIAELREEQKHLQNLLAQAQNTENAREIAKLREKLAVCDDPGYLAVSRGYDAVGVADSRMGESHIMVFNRSALWVENRTEFGDYE